VGIVGARRCTAYGKEVAREAATFLAKRGIPVISGMARGIDSYANTACLQAGGYTLAFLGHGVDTCFPADHRELMEAIVEHGAVLSAYPPGTEARPEFFPQRNYLISAWSYRVAGGGSGAAKRLPDYGKAGKRAGTPCLRSA
jgi:predicted Rossmann fold nucleotide-binding protein DprA/Smf involved in DNA uptake